MAWATEGQVMVEAGTLEEDSQVSVMTCSASTLRGLAQPRTSHAGTAEGEERKGQRLGMSKVIMA